MDNILFLDTCALLNMQSAAFEKFFYISQKTLEEIESIKTSTSKDGEIKAKARHMAHLLDENYGSYKVVPASNHKIYELIDRSNVDHTVDNIIMATASIIGSELGQDIVLVSDDINVKIIGREIFHLTTKGSKDIALLSDRDIYTGYTDLILSDDEMSKFYTTLNNVPYDYLENQYVIIRKSDGEVVDQYVMHSGNLEKVCDITIKSLMFGDKIRPKDPYQACAIHSILNNTMTAMTGKAGSGKSLLSLATITSLIERGEYSRMVIMFNPTKARGAADMGYYGGDAIDKAMQNSIGSILTTKFGDRFAVDMLLQKDQLRLVSMADVRGMEVRDDEILYITECQNTTVDLIKLCLSRASSGCKIVVEGDYNTQVDSYLYNGDSNGLKRVIDVFQGDESFGYVNLPNVWRSKIANMVDKL